MTYLVIEIRTITSTFRNPDFQNFHKSFYLPPPTTLLGLAGSALGISPKASQEWFDDNLWYLGVAGTSEGYAKDLWKYSTLSNDPQKKSSVLLREILFDNRFLAVFGCADESKIEKLKYAFWYPHYALTLGSSDSLAKVVSIQTIYETSKSRDLENCLVLGNVLSDVIENIPTGEDFSIYTSSEPIAYDLPTNFQYESDYGVRRIKRRQTLSFIGARMQLNFLVNGINVKNRFIPVFPLNNDLHQEL